MNKIISYSLKRSPRSRALRVSVYCDGRCVVTAPQHAPESAISDFVASRADWIRRALERFMPFRPYVRRKSSRREYLKHRESARALVLSRLPELNRAYGFKYGRVAIKDQKSRWGSCSERGNLNFNYRLALVSPRLADYVIVHELCHIAEFNHSPQFWALVERSLPDYRERRAELRRLSLREI